ncbi:MAG: hypothetical protein HKN63_07775, partial [Rhodobacteraceae bacterium]|nr:hypothetical protein [Paracoccaceae bacterium]
MQRILGIVLAACCLLAGLVSAGPARAETGDSAGILEALLTPQETSLPQISARRTLRLGVPNSAIFFWYDGDKLVGLGVDIARELERHLSQTRETAIDVIVTPLPRGELLQAVGEGRIDLA